MDKRNQPINMNRAALHCRKTIQGILNTLHWEIHGYYKPSYVPRI